MNPNIKIERPLTKTNNLSLYKYFEQYVILSGLTNYVQEGALGIYLLTFLTVEIYYLYRASGIHVYTEFNSAVPLVGLLLNIAVVFCTSAALRLKIRGRYSQGRIYD